DFFNEIRKGDSSLISINSLKKVYHLVKEEITAVDDISLQINEGDIFGVIGYSGAGKSTFVRLLNRLEEPTAGSISMQGKEMTTLSNKELRVGRQDIGMIFQHYSLLWWRNSSDRDNPVVRSGAPPQRAGIARRLANDPKVLPGHEAPSAWQPDTTNAILHLLVDINKKLRLTIILVTPLTHVIRKPCNRIA